MHAWRRRVGLVGLVLVVFASGYLGARLGLMNTPVAQASHNFSDVPDSAFYHSFVQFLVDAGITGGCGAGRFCGESPVTRGQMAVFLQKLSDVLPVCPPDSVKVGAACIDRYEASVWETADPAIVAKIRAGTVTLADLQGGAVQRGLANDDFGSACPLTGNGCVNVYAVSIAGVIPSRFVTWFQAVAAARNAGKRLTTNAEWQAAALGTPDPGDTPGAQDCPTSGVGLNLTGARANCVSDAGAFDMVGNLHELVADWGPPATACPAGLFGTEDANCLGIDPQGAAAPSGPAALIRGGTFIDGVRAGVFAVETFPPSIQAFHVGFRAAR